MSTATTPGPQLVSVEHRNATAIVRFTNPPMGYIPTRGAIQLLDTFRTLLGDPAVRVVILTGGLPDVFIRHADVSSIVRNTAALAEGKITPDDFANNPFIVLVDLLDKAEKPVIAAINGFCMGGGLETALACTVRIASRSVTAIGLPEVRLNILPGAGGMPRLARIVGPHRARLHSLKGTVFTAAQALDEGIVDELADNALERALELADTFTRRDQASLAAILRGSYADYSTPDIGRQLGSLMREPGVVARLEQFVERGERLDQIA